MYLLNAESEILWVIPPTASPPIFTDFDVVEINPLGEITYLNSIIDPIDYVIPTVDTPGSVSYLITPNLEGHWKIRLAIGTASNYQTLSKVEMYVFDNTTIVNPIKNTPEGVNGAIEIADINGLITSEATKLAFVSAQFLLSETNGVVTINLEGYPVVTYQSPNDLLNALVDSISESQLIASLRTRIDLVDGTAAGSVNERLQLEADARIAADADVQQSVTTLRTDTDGNLATIDIALTALSDKDIAIALDITELTGVVGGNTAAISTETGLRVSEDEVLALRIDSIEVTVGDNISSAVFNDAILLLTDNDSALAQQITTLSTTVGINTASIQTNLTSINGIYAEYTVKLDVNGNVSGFGLIADAESSEFAVVVDRFSIVSADGLDSSVPFFHLTVPTEIDGVLIPAGTYMESAYIADGTITNLKIGNVIESNDGGATWSIDKEGSIFAQNATIAGSIRVTNPDEVRTDLNVEDGATATSSANLVVNGDAEFGDNTNFSATVYTTAESRSGDGSFSITGTDPSLLSDDYIPVSDAKQYLVRASAKSGDGTKTTLLGVNCLNKDKIQILPYMDWRDTNKNTTLFEAVAPTDTVIKIVPASESWYVTASPFSYIQFNTQADFSDLPQMDISQIDIIDESTAGSGYWTLTLSSPAGVTAAVGSSVGNSHSGSSYTYILSGSAPGDEEWHDFTALLKPRTEWGTFPAAYEIRTGTAYLKAYWRPTYLGSVSVTSYLDAIYIAEYVNTDWANLLDSTNSLPADNADVTETALETGTTITSGGITISSGGYFKSFGVANENVDVTPGVWFGYNSTTSEYTFGVGDADAYIKYNSTNGLQVKTGDTTVNGIELNPDGDGEFHFYSDNGYGTVEELVTIGVSTIGSDSVLVGAGSAASSKLAFRGESNFTAIRGIGNGGFGVYGESLNNGYAGIYGKNDAISGNPRGVWGTTTNASGSGVYGECTAGYGVYGWTSTGSGVIGTALSGRGVFGHSSTGYGGYFNSAGGLAAAIVLVPGTRTSAPVHVAAKGAVWLRSDASVYVNYNGATGWRYVG